MDGAKLRDEGIKQALEAESEDWVYAYHMLCIEMFKDIPKDSVFSSEKFSETARREIGEPHHPGVWGGVFRKFIHELKRDGHVQDAGFASTVRPSSHNRITRLYRRVR